MEIDIDKTHPSPVNGDSVTKMTEAQNKLFESIQIMMNIIQYPEASVRKMHEEKIISFIKSYITVDKNPP